MWYNDKMTSRNLSSRCPSTERFGGGGLATYLINPWLKIRRLRSKPEAPISLCLRFQACYYLVCPRKNIGIYAHFALSHVQTGHVRTLSSSYYLLIKYLASAKPRTWLSPSPSNRIWWDLTWFFVWLCHFRPLELCLFIYPLAFIDSL